MENKTKLNWVRSSAIQLDFDSEQNAFDAALKLAMSSTRNVIVVFPKKMQRMACLFLAKWVRADLANMDAIPTTTDDAVSMRVRIGSPSVRAGREVGRQSRFIEVVDFTESPFVTTKKPDFKHSDLIIVGGDGIGVISKALSDKARVYHFCFQSHDQHRFVTIPSSVHHDIEIHVSDDVFFGCFPLPGNRKPQVEPTFNPTPFIAMKQFF